MLISVIIPTFNRKLKVINAINSVLRQTYKGFELIVVDDGSEDGTYEELKRIKDKRLKVIRQSHQGVASARNRGVSESKGELIAFLDSDDIWLPNKLEEHIKFHLQGEWQISQTEEIWIRKGRFVNPMLKHRKRAGWIFEPSLNLCLISPSCVMFSKRLWIELGGFDESLLTCEDYDLWLRYSLFYPVGLLPKKLVIRYAGHSDQLSHTFIGQDLYRIYSLLKILKKRLCMSKREKVKEVLRKKALIYIKGCLKRGKFEEAQRIKELVKDFVDEMRK